jgi:hypothetical protein
MKMENVLRTGRDGMAAEIKVTADQVLKTFA